MMRHNPPNSNDRDRNNDFVRNVLSRTSGSPCDRACEQLPGLMDGKLGGMDRQLVQAHLEHCDGCRSVAVVLGWMQPMFTDMAQLDPGPAFTKAVVLRTSGAVHPLARAARRGETVGPLGIVDRLGSWWQRQIFRPRFALEFAYVATVILVLLTAVPGAPLKQEARNAQEMMQAGPMAMPLVGPILNHGQDQLDEISLTARHRAGGQWDQIIEDWDARLNRSDEAARAAINHLDLAWRLGRTGQLSQAGFQLMAAGQDTRQAWNQWWRQMEIANRNNPNQ